MKLEYNIWNITNGWQPMQATSLKEAQHEIEAMGPYGEEAVIRDEDGQVYRQNQNLPKLNFGP